jgi:ribosome recycling factor
MSSKAILKDANDRMTKAVEVVRDELSKIRTGKATTTLLDGIKVDYYGTMTPLHQVANVSTPDVHTIAVQPWEKTMIQPIEKAVMNADLGLNPSSDGDLVRVPIPPLNEERRRELVKLIKRFGEEGKIAIRNVRRDAIEHLKKAEKEEHFSEDERKRAEQECQKLTDSHVKDVDELLGLKEKEIMEV